MILDRQELIYDIIHDLKSPLAAILGLSEVFLRMLSSNLNENQKEVVRKINRHARFTLDLVEDLLDLERIASGQLVIGKVNVNLEQFLSEIAQTHSIPAAEKNIIIEYHNMGTCELNTDERRLKQVFDNLLTNAVKFSHPGTIVTIESRVDEKTCQISIKDQGIGIKQEEMDKLFKPFSQLSGRPTGNEKSTGLGLSIVKNLVELLDGTIWVESKENVGSTFTVKLARG